ncbi:MAG TPA: thiamine-phosphate kinase [Sphingomicrobium sp.]|nr:thiamine-phosphate kinase [Sphingomicrobium sp.]
MSTSELAFIDRLRLLATDPAARGLDDDAAVIGDLVLTHDMVAEGVHFLPSDPPASVGWKLVAVNLSDLAAKGADPIAALMGFTLGDDSDWDERFLSGIAAACETYGIALVGGDTIALPDGAPRVLGLTAIGRGGERIPPRSGGRPGDALWLVGTLGDAAAGLELLFEDEEAEGPLVEAYRRPVPQLAAGKMLAPHANAMMDVSDGLLLDLERLCAASKCGAKVDFDALPLSRAYIAETGSDRRARLKAATGGDDYALLAAMPDQYDPLGLSLPPGTILQRVGTLTAGEGVQLFDVDGEVPLPEQLGYEHRA